MDCATTSGMRNVKAASLAEALRLGKCHHRIRPSLVLVILVADRKTQADLADQYISILKLR